MCPGTRADLLPAVQPVKLMKRKVFQLGDILVEPEKFLWGAFVFALFEDGLTLDTPAIVIPDLDPELEEETISVDGFEKLDFEELLSVDDIVSVRENLRNQGQVSDAETMLVATKYYYQYDAYITL